MAGRHPLEITLAILVGLAVTTLLASRHPMVGPLGSAIVLALAVLKGRLILLDFLGLRAAPAIWRGLVTAWVLCVASLAWAASAVRLLM